MIELPVMVVSVRADSSFASFFVRAAAYRAFLFSGVSVVAIRDGLLSIISASAIFQVIRSIVHPDIIFVTDFKAFRALSDEGKCYELMNACLKPSLVSRKGNKQISFRTLCLNESYQAADAPYQSCFGSLVEAFPARNVLPRFSGWLSGKLAASSPRHQVMRLAHLASNCCPAAAGKPAGG